MRLGLDWRSFLLRPEPSSSPRDHARFVAYTASWQRPRDEEPSLPFAPWSTHEGPPSHSLPPHCWVKEAQRAGTGEAAESFHSSLFPAYFHDHRDITATPVLGELWQRAGLPEIEDLAAFSETVMQRHTDQVIAEHLEAAEQGASGAPAVRVADGFGVVMGAQRPEVYRRWLQRLAARASHEA